MQSGSAADGSYLLAVDDGDKRTLVVWEWRSRRLIARTVVSRSFLFRQSKPLGVSARPLTDELDPSICSHLSERHTNSQKLETWPSLRLCPAPPSGIMPSAPPWNGPALYDHFNDIASHRAVEIQLYKLHTLSLSFNRQLDVAYIDIKSAFDSVDRVALWKALRGSGMPPFLLQLT